jgi:hypothetical protein
VDGYTRLKTFLEEYLKKLNSGSSVGGIKEPPIFELFPSDYLKFAEQELSIYFDGKSYETRALINCILHLKRALDCQLDVFFYRLGISVFIKKMNLGLNSKLEFLQNVGIIKSRSIERFNKLRNKIEHHYQIPNVEDIEVYYDLITTLISNIEMTILALYSGREFELHDLDGNYFVSFVYDFTSIPIIHIKIRVKDDVFEQSFSIEDYGNFSRIFKVYLLLLKKDSFASKDYILSLI